MPPPLSSSRIRAARVSQRHNEGRPWRLVLFVLVALLNAQGCAPGGPSRAELFAEPEFAATMPGASEQGRGGSDAAFSLEGSYESFATRMLVAQDDEESVLSWHRAAYEAVGWTPVGYSYIGMQDGRSPQNAWRRGGLVLGLGFPDRDRLHVAYPAGTLYEITIIYRPDASDDP
jgi:hypothetical protein